MQSQVKYKYEFDENKTRFNQGDILKDVEIVLSVDIIVKNENEQEYKISTLNLQYGIVINQECDLDLDYKGQISDISNQDKLLPSIIILPAYLSESFKSGIHRDGMTCQKWNSDQWKIIKQNNNSRFHFVDESTNYQIPELVVDFKHIYTINRNIIYKKINHLYCASLSELFRENLSNRYCQYLGRIGLPEIN